MAKKIKAYIKLQIPAGTATPSPPVGPALGQQGVNIIEFCKIFNNKTTLFEKGIPIPVIITVYVDKTFNLIIKTPPAAFLLKKAANIKLGSSDPKTKKAGKITIVQINKIAKIKMNDMTGTNLEAMSRSIAGTARSIGLVIEE